MGAVQGMGWCAYADISLALRRLRAVSHGALTKFMIVDLDAHQGNGVARVRQHFADDGCFIVDCFNARVFPRDTVAKQVRVCACVCVCVNVNVHVLPLRGCGGGEEGRCVDVLRRLLDCLQGIDVRRELAVGTGDAVYLETVRGALEEAFERCQPDLVIYNAGTDILAGERSCCRAVAGEQLRRRSCRREQRMPAACVSPIAARIRN